MLYNGVILDGLHGDGRFLDSARNDGERSRLPATRWPLTMGKKMDLKVGI